jgi:hypothetical protein
MQSIPDAPVTHRTIRRYQPLINGPGAPMRPATPSRTTSSAFRDRTCTVDATGLVSPAVVTLGDRGRVPANSPGRLLRQCTTSASTVVTAPTTVARPTVKAQAFRDLVHQA